MLAKMVMAKNTISHANTKTMQQNVRLEMDICAGRLAEAISLRMSVRASLAILAKSEWMRSVSSVEIFSGKCDSNRVNEASIFATLLTMALTRLQTV